METEQIFGVLNDYDFAVKMDRKDGATSKQRTGTLPYMAKELLESDQPTKHAYRHDLESIFYCIADMVLRDVYIKRPREGRRRRQKGRQKGRQKDRQKDHQKDHRRRRPALWKWRELSMKGLASEKTIFIYDQIFTGEHFKDGFAGYKFIIAQFQFLYKLFYVNCGSFKQSLSPTEAEYHVSRLIDFEKFDSIMQFLKRDHLEAAAPPTAPLVLSDPIPSFSRFEFTPLILPVDNRRTGSTVPLTPPRRPHYLPEGRGPPTAEEEWYSDAHVLLDNRHTASGSTVPLSPSKRPRYLPDGRSPPTTEEWHSDGYETVRE